MSTSAIIFMTISWVVIIGFSAITLASLLKRRK